MGTFGHTGNYSRNLYQNDENMSYKKIDKEFCLSDDSVNVYGYRALTTGCELSRFVPAIGYLMHNRDNGVAVRWEDFRIADGKIYAKPVVNLTKYPTLADEIEDGFYNAASVGKIVALEVSTDEKYMLEGQTGPTVLRWFPRECSIVDIPGNYSALAQLLDESDNVLYDLSDTTNTNNIFKEMKEKVLTSSDLALLDLKDDATDAQVSVALRDLSDKAKRTDKAEKDLQDLQDKVAADRVKDLLDNGTNDRKLSKELRGKLEVDYKGRPDELKALIDAMPAQVIVTDKLHDVPAKYAGKTWNDLYLSGDLADIKAKYPDLYDELKKNR